MEDAKMRKDDEGYPTIFDQQLVDEAAIFIAAELKVLLDRKNIDSPMNRRIREACPAYRHGLSNGDMVLATLKALHLVGLDITNDMTSLTREPTLGEMARENALVEQEEIERELANNPAVLTTEEFMRRIGASGREEGGSDGRDN
jgi:hypothetical protein